MRKECLNRNHSNTLFKTRVVIGDFKSDHNHRHGHSALQYRMPAESPAACRCTHTPVAVRHHVRTDQTNPTLEPGLGNGTRQNEVALPPQDGVDDGRAQGRGEGDSDPL
jgi:hypothetical protein